MVQDNAAEEGVPGDAFVSPVCFLQGTKILTPRGEVAIEALVAGDTVIGQSGIRTVKWIGYRNTLTRSIPIERRAEHMPVRIMRGAVADGVPSKDLLVSPGHHIMVDGKLVRARDLLNGHTILTEFDLTSYQYFHIELDQFDVVSAHGLMSESWADGGNRDYFHNVDVTQLRASDMQRRKAYRPGFMTLRQGPVLERIQVKLGKRALGIARRGTATATPPAHQDKKTA